MSAETLRRAAALMRERAEGATPGPWSNRRGPDECVVRADDGAPLARTDTRADRRHIASWHPLVALAVADWLDGVATFAGYLGRGSYYRQHPEDLAPHPAIAPALAVARTYLGESA